MIKKVLYKTLNLQNPLTRFSLRLFRSYRLRQYMQNDYKVLEIAGGSMPLESTYLNVDISPAAEVDVVTDLLGTIPLPDNHCQKIISIATLEHFTLPDVQHILKEFFRLLASGGSVEIGVPSLAKILAQYNKRGCDDEVLRYLHGGLKDKYDVHFFVVDPARFITELQKAGFVKVEEVTYDFPRHSADFMMKLVAYKP